MDFSSRDRGGSTTQETITRSNSANSEITDFSFVAEDAAETTEEITVETDDGLKVAKLIQTTARAANVEREMQRWGMVLGFSDAELEEAYEAHKTMDRPNGMMALCTIGAVAFGSILVRHGANSTYLMWSGWELAFLGTLLLCAFPMFAAAFRLRNQTFDNRHLIGRLRIFAVVLSTCFFVMYANAAIRDIELIPGTNAKLLVGSHIGKSPHRQ